MKTYLGIIGFAVIGAITTTFIVILIRHLAQYLDRLFSKIFKNK